MPTTYIEDFFVDTDGTDLARHLPDTTTTGSDWGFENGITGTIQIESNTATGLTGTGDECGTSQQSAYDSGIGSEQPGGILLNIEYDVTTSFDVAPASDQHELGFIYADGIQNDGTSELGGVFRYRADTGEWSLYNATDLLYNGNPAFTFIASQSQSLTNGSHTAVIQVRTASVTLIVDGSTVMTSGAAYLPFGLIGGDGATNTTGLFLLDADALHVNTFTDAMTGSGVFNGHTGTWSGTDGSGTFSWLGATGFFTEELTSAVIATPGQGYGNGAFDFITDVAPNAGNTGAGYTVGDVLTVVGGTFTTPVSLRVDHVDAFGGIISTLTILNNGVYTVDPPNNVSVTGGTGNSAQLILSWNGYYPPNGELIQPDGGVTFAPYVAPDLYVTTVQSLLGPDPNNGAMQALNLVSGGVYFAPFGGFVNGTYDVLATGAGANGQITVTVGNIEPIGPILTGSGMTYEIDSLPSNAGGLPSGTVTINQASLPSRPANSICTFYSKGQIDTAFPTTPTDSTHPGQNIVVLTFGPGGTGASGAAIQIFYNQTSGVWSWHVGASSGALGGPPTNLVYDFTGASLVWKIDGATVLTEPRSYAGANVWYLPALALNELIETTNVTVSNISFQIGGYETASPMAFTYYKVATPGGGPVIVPITGLSAMPIVFSMNTVGFGAIRVAQWLVYLCGLNNLGDLAAATYGQPNKFLFDELALGEVSGQTQPAQDLHGTAPFTWLMVKARRIGGDPDDSSVDRQCLGSILLEYDEKAT